MLTVYDMLAFQFPDTNQQKSVCETIDRFAESRQSDLSISDELIDRQNETVRLIMKSLHTPPVSISVSSINAWRVKIDYLVKKHPMNL